MNKGQTRAVSLHLVSFFTGAMAMFSVAGAHQADLVAAWDHLHTAFKELTAAWVIIVPVATMAYAAYKNATSVKLADVINDPKAPEAAEKLPATPQAVKVADALKQNG